MIEKRLLIPWVNYGTNLKHKLFPIHISTNEMAKVDHNAFLSEPESRNLSLSNHFGGDSTLVPQIVNVRN